MLTLSVPRRASRLLVFLAALAVVAAVAVAPAQAAVQVVRPAAVKGQKATFRLSGIPGRAIASAHVSRGERRVRIPLSRARAGAARGRLRVKVGRRAGRARLVLGLASKRPARTVKPTTTTTTTTTTAPEPTTTTTTTTTGSTGGAATSCGWGTFKAGLWPGACWRPYADDSPWNRGVPAGAKLASDSSAVLSRLLGFGRPMSLEAGDAGTSGDYEHPVFYSQPTDPVYTVDCLEDWGKCLLEGIEIRVPDAARAAAGGDGHMTVVDQATGWEYDFWQVRSKPSGGGVITTTWGGKTRIDGDGRGSDATAARFGNLAGIIRAQEMFAGEINHALFMTVKCDSGAYVYPAMKTGRTCSDIGLSNTNAPAMGAHFVLDMTTAEIDALSVPAWKKTILRAMARYGMFVGDTGGDSWGLQFESGTTYESFGVQDEMVRFGRENSVPTYEGRHIFNLRDGVDWSRLKLVDPCVSQGTC